MTTRSYDRTQKANPVQPRDPVKRAVDFLRLTCHRYLHNRANTLDVQQAMRDVDAAIAERRARDNARAS